MTIEQFHAAGHDVDRPTFDRLAAFLDQLLAENSKLNLTAIRDAQDAWVLHILDSLALRPLLLGRAAKRVVDLGTGGGVPGGPLACVLPEVQFRLIDGTRKKIDAVARIASSIGLTNVEPVWGRAEELAARPDHAAWADVIVARAVAKLPVLVPLAGALTRVGGACALMKSCVGLDAEVASAAKPAIRAGMRFCETRIYSLPNGHGQRAIVVYERER